MQTEVIAVRDTLPVAVLAGLLSEKEISGVPVVDDGKRLVGVVSRADLVRPPELSDETVMVDELLDGFAPEPKSCVRDVMSRTLHQVDESASLKDAIELMLRERIHRLVVTREGAVTGIVTSFDMMKMLAIVLRS